jgi:hypothetical protein
MQNLVSDTKTDRDQLEDFDVGPGKRKILVPGPEPGPLCRSIIVNNKAYVTNSFKSVLYVLNGLLDLSGKIISISF